MYGASVGAGPSSPPTSPFMGADGTTTEASPLISRISSLSVPSSPGRMIMPTEEKRRRAKRFALIAACIIPMGAHYTKQSLAPLRPYFEEAGTSSYNFGLLLSAAAWPNLLQPFLAGLFIDSKGHEHGAIVFTALALFGHAIFASSLTKSGIADSSITQAVVGRMVFGLGSGGSGVVQGAIIGHHFQEDITFAVGFTESIHHLANWLGKATPVPIAVAFSGSFQASVWIGCSFMLLSFLMAVAYVVFEEIHKPFVFALNPGKHTSGKVKRHVSLDTISSRTTDLVAEDSSYFQASWGLIYSLPTSFWALGILHLLFSNIANLFAGFSTSYLVETFALPPESAAYYASVDAFLPIFVSPFVGRWIDKHGGRLSVCFISGLVCALSFLLLLYIGEELPYGPLIPVLLISISTCTAPTLIKSCVPLVSPREALGTAFSIYLVFEAIGASIGHVGLGYLKDLTNSYRVDLYILLSISLSASLATLVVKRYDDRRLQGLLNGSKPNSGELIL